MATKAYYKFNSDATDSSGNGYNLTTAGSPTITATNGNFGGCLELGTSNTTKYAYIDNALGMTGATAKTYRFWGKLNTNPGSGLSMIWFRHLYGGQATGNYANVTYYNNSGTYEVRMPTSPAGMAVAYTLTVGAWYYFVVTVPASNTGDLTCYVDGKAIGTTPNWSQNYALTTRLAIGADHALSNISDVAVDEFVVEDSLWDAVKIRHDYTQAKGRYTAQMI